MGRGTGGGETGSGAGGRGEVGRLPDWLSGSWYNIPHTERRLHTKPWNGNRHVSRRLGSMHINEAQEPKAEDGPVE